MALFRGIQEYIALDTNNNTLVFDSGNIVNISGNIFLSPPQGHPMVYKYLVYFVCMHHYMRTNYLLLCTGGWRTSPLYLNTDIIIHYLGSSLG